MLSKMQINNFKSIESTEINFASFTFLVGMNSSGKSTVIQSLLLAAQNLASQTNNPLNGLLVSLGTFQESRNFITNSKEIELKIFSENSEEVNIKVEDKNGKTKAEITNSDSELGKYLNFSNKKIKYLSSHRIGNQDLYSLNYSDITEIGLLGEFAVDYFEKNKTKPIVTELIKDKVISSTLEAQVNYWLNYILNGEIRTENIEGTDSVKAQYKIMNSRFVRPKNVGAGLSYVISLLITLLASKPGDINIIENPEIHLHPRAQSRLTEFMVFISTKEVKLIVESHSDHIFNGLRKAIYKGQINIEEVSAYYFELDKRSLSQITPIEFNNKGKVTYQIPGLFDQFDDDLDVLLGIN
ncbi:AAA family ATPase [Planococcus citreus]|uniref:Putative ATPase n=1 Tax=Planococcus citreus TaxID=1373 RepID=A0A497YEA3_9BACL|nr:DUF3696 domain-containing protein [Planococcus citreus]RLJ86624.1 putative ATPase [Planococcus citreus]